MSAIKEIEQAVLALPVKQRAQLAESLLQSLPSLGDEWSEAEELAEVERRERQIASGEVQPLSEKKFWKQVEARRRKR
jgi:putative addiction module component (TIGR02574 family)